MLGRLFGPKKQESSVSQPPPSTLERAEIAVGRATTVDYAAKGLQSGIAAATAIGATAVIASGPALPIVAGVGILAAAALRLYTLNKKVTKLFQRADKLIRRMLPVVDAIQTASEKRGLNIDLTDVRATATEIQMTIGELIGPQALKEINAAVQSGKELPTAQRKSWSGRLNRLGRMMAPTTTITRFNEQLIQLALDFGIVQGEFAIALEKLTPDEAKEAAVERPVDPLAVVTPDSLNAAKQGADTPRTNDEALTTGGKRTRRRRKRRATRRN